MDHARSFCVKNDKCYYLKVDGLETLEDHTRNRASLDHWLKFAKKDYVEVYDYSNWSVNSKKLKELYLEEQKIESRKGRKALVIIGHPEEAAFECFKTEDRIFASNLDSAVEIVESLGFSIDDMKYDLNHIKSCDKKRYDCLYELR